MNYHGTIIEESLEDKAALKDCKILETKVENVVEAHRTPWVKQWTLHSVEIPEGEAERLAEKLSKALDSDHVWYADYKTDTHRYIIFKNKVFFVDMRSKEQNQEARDYGISLGIPEYQVDFKTV